MFDLILQARLQASDFHQKIEFLIDGFIAKNLITLLYAEGGSGKSWLAYAIAKHAAEKSMDVIYLDYDNPITVLAERELETKLINCHDNLYYVSSSKADCTSTQMVEHIQHSTQGNNLNNTLICIDSLRDFFDVRNDNQALAFMAKLKDLRGAGATIVVLSHSNKDARNYEGSNNIYNSVDNMFQVTKLENKQHSIKYLLDTRKDRAGTGDCAFLLDTQSLALTPLPVAEAKMSNEDKDFIEKAKAVLVENNSLNKKELLNALGFDKRDKTANKRLDRYTDKVWVCQKKSNVYTYQLKQSS